MSKVDPYHLDPSFERALVTACATQPRVFTRLGTELEVEALASPAAQLLLRASCDIARETGSGPSAGLLVLQRLRRWMDDGRVALERVQEAAAYLEAGIEAGVPEADALVAEVRPLLQRRLRAQAVRAVIDDFGKGGEMTGARQLMARADRVGDAQTALGVQLGAGSFAEIGELSNLDRLPTGVTELDDVLEGGPPRGTLSLVLGGSNDGKSMYLSQQTAVAARFGLFVAAATLELPRPYWIARVKAALMGVPINALIARPTHYQERLAEMQLGPVFVEEFSASATSMGDIEQWVDRVEQQMGRAIDVLVTDYGDKLIAPKSSSSRDESGYTTGRVVFERMRVYAVERAAGKIWHWSASQATRKKDQRKRLDLNDFADSMHKARVADLVITLNLQEEDQMAINVAKNRHGPARVTVGPLPADFACGLVAPVIPFAADARAVLGDAKARRAVAKLRGIGEGEE